MNRTLFLISIATKGIKAVKNTDYNLACIAMNNVKEELAKAYFEGVIDDKDYVTMRDTFNESLEELKQNLLKK